MAYSSSFTTVPSLYHPTPNPTPTLIPPLSSLHFTTFSSKSHFQTIIIKTAITKRSTPFVHSAVLTTDSPVLSEEAFKGIGGFGSFDADFDESEGDTDEAASNEDQLDVSKLGLPRRLVDTLARRGITQLFPIQRAVLVPSLGGRDIIARAKTGTGKTLAFGIPILKSLCEAEEERGSLRRGRLPKVLVLAPTRELAKQVEKEFKESAPYLNTVCIYGGVSYITQQSALSRGVDVVVGTPGRIIDLIKNDSLKLGEVQNLVLDEADQMLAVGFEEDVELILKKLPSERQSMLFSATMPSWIKKLSRKYLNNPLTIDLVGDQEEKLAEGIKLYAIPASAASRRNILGDLVTVYAKGGKAIIFTRTKREADELSMELPSSIASQALHGDISQYQRERTLNGFRQGRFSVLVATDVAARGLDIPNVDLIIHYELPNNPETFVHRSGRTGRAGKEGTAVLMFANSQKRMVRSLERDVGCKFEFVSPPSAEEVLESSAKHVFPAFQDDGPPSDSYRRSSNSNRRPVRASGDRRGVKSSRDWLNDGDKDEYSRGGHGSRSQSSWPRFSKSSGDDWSIGDRRSNRSSSSSGSRDRAFGGACFNCGRSGHRASECPGKRGY